MAAGLAHLLALPHKMPLSREEYLTVQQLYAINRFVRDQVMRKRQNPLPGFDEGQ